MMYMKPICYTCKNLIKKTGEKLKCKKYKDIPIKVFESGKCKYYEKVNK